MIFFCHLQSAGEEQVLFQPVREFFKMRLLKQHGYVLPDLFELLMDRTRMRFRTLTKPKATPGEQLVAIHHADDLRHLLPGMSKYSIILPHNHNYFPNPIET